jgi:hypothetical protein
MEKPIRDWLGLRTLIGKTGEKRLLSEKNDPPLVVRRKNR